MENKLYEYVRIKEEQKISTEIPPRVYKVSFSVSLFLEVYYFFLLLFFSIFYSFQLFYPFSDLDVTEFFLSKKLFFEDSRVLSRAPYFCFLERREHIFIDEASF